MKNHRVLLDKKTLDELFQDATPADTSKIIIALYRMVFPEWDDLETIGPWPRISRETALDLMGRFKRIAPAAALAWMNAGFSVVEAPADLRFLEVDRSACTPKVEKD